MRIIEPKAGQTIVVSAASGAVGSAVGQLARQRGCRAVGLAGGPDKCAYVVDTLGFDACIDYKQHPDLKSLSAALKAACPDGIDGYFENVGGVTLDARAAAHERLRPHRRVRHDLGIRRAADPAAAAAAHPRLAAAGAGLHRRRAHGRLARGAEGTRHPRRDRPPEVPRVGRPGHRGRAGGLPRPAKGRNFGKQLVKLV